MASLDRPTDNWLLRYWGPIAFAVGMAGGMTAAWYNTSGKMQAACDNLQRVEKIVDDIPNTYITKEVVEIKLDSMEEKIDLQGEDLRDIKKALGVK